MSRDTIQEQKLAAEYGYALSVLKSDQGLYNAFQDAVKNDWEPARFVAAVRDTAWFKKHAESWRNTEIMRLSDPQTYKARLAESRVKVIAAARNLGASLSEDEINSISTNMFRLGQSDAVLANTLATHVNFVKNDLIGQAGAVDQALRETAERNGVRWSDQERLTAARNVVAGKFTIQDYQDQLRKSAASTYPSWAEQINAGMDVAELADPYKKSMASLLEIPEESVTLFDPTLRAALTAKTADGKPAVKTVWEFENDLRKDPRWAKTQNGMSTVAKTVKGVLDAWGFAG